MRQASKAPVWVRYITVPLLFVVGIVLVLSIGLGPIAAPYLGLAKFFFSKTPTPQPTDLFTGTAISEAGQGATVPLSQIVYPGQGDLYGNIAIAGTSVSAPVYYGDTTRILNLGVGTYVDHPGAGIPGESKTILLGGHNNTFFNGLQDVKEGAEVTVQTHYGSYVYRVTKTLIADHNDETTYDFSKKNENLILYTCYPFDALGFTSDRYFVYADYVSGPVIDATA